MRSALEEGVATLLAGPEMARRRGVRIGVPAASDRLKPPSGCRGPPLPPPPLWLSFACSSWMALHRRSAVSETLKW